MLIMMRRRRKGEDDDDNDDENEENISINTILNDFQMAFAIAPMKRQMKVEGLKKCRVSVTYCNVIETLE